MEAEGLLKRADSITPHFYHLKSHPKAYNIFNYKHEKICGDIYLSLINYLDYWEAKTYEDLERVGLRPDRQSRINNKPIFWEIDRSTMTKAKIIEKLKKYIRLGKSNQREFSVVIASTPRRAKSLLNELYEFKNPYAWFYTVDYKELMENPTGQIFYAPTKERVTLVHPNVSSETSL
jgi:protein involved in plasmid replication-relaxation